MPPIPSSYNTCTRSKLKYYSYSRREQWFVARPKFVHLYARESFEVLRRRCRVMPPSSRRAPLPIARHHLGNDGSELQTLCVHKSVQRVCLLQAIARRVKSNNTLVIAKNDKYTVMHIREPQNVEGFVASPLWSAATTSTAASSCAIQWRCDALHVHLTDKMKQQA